MKKGKGQIVRIADLSTRERERLGSLGIDVLLFSDCYILPGFTDVHVHLREPGFLYKETMATGTAAAAAGGFTQVCAMPNLNPCPDSLENLRVQLAAIQKDACVGVLPYGAITKGQAGKVLADLEELAPYVIAFTDDGRGVMDPGLMEEAMARAKALDRPIVAHCEDEGFPKDSRETEWKQLERDLLLAEKTGCPYHMCHASTREAVRLMREAKAAGLNVTCETAPHYLLLDRERIRQQIQGPGGGRFKMNPPIKDREDREALLEGLADGTIDMIATDHAPHSEEEKGRGFSESAFGIVGLETAFPVLYTELVEQGIISLEKLVRLLNENPRKRFGLEAGSLREGRQSWGRQGNRGQEERPDLCIWDLEGEYTVDLAAFQTKGRSTPFAGWTVRGRCLLTVAEGRIVWQRKRESQKQGNQKQGGER